MKDVKINKNSVLRAVGCMPDSPVYDSVSEEYDKYIEEAQRRIDLKTNYYFENDRVYVLISAGNGISDLSKELFDKGEAVAGLIVNAIADEYIFSGDSEVSGEIKTECARRRMGIDRRIDELMPGDIVDIANKTNAGVRVTEGYMFNPPKTLGYILKLTDDESVFNAQHDWSKCKNLGCPRRTADYSDMKIISGYEYEEEIQNTVCIDIGTTTIVMKHLETGKTVTMLNAQKRFGLDVLSRIEASNRGRKNELRQLIVYQLQKGVELLTKNPEKIIISANTVMVHLLMGYSCERLGVFPFVPSSTDTVKTTFDKLTNSKIQAPVTITGGISAFVGGDIVSGLYMCDFDISERKNLFIDLGTNGEIALGNRDGIFTSSTAAGPAFEGGKIRCGTGSVDGAICGVDLKAKKFRTINDKAPVGICGSGMIELLSELKDNNLMDSTGRMDDFRINDKIIFTQTDVRELQTAKSAVRAGIELLLMRGNTGYGEIENVYLAGGFGFHLNIKKACNIGLLPPELIGKVKAVGNSSLGGAAKYAESNDDERIEHIRKISTSVSLAEDEMFGEKYMEYMYF